MPQKRRLNNIFAAASAALLTGARLILGYHLILTAYGFWLPNDPRGSWSDFVGAWELLKFGPATKVNSGRSVAAMPHNHELRRAAKAALKYPPVEFTGHQASAIAQGFREACTVHEIRVWACAILPEHVHLVIQRHALRAEGIGWRLKIESTRALRSAGLHPFEELATDKDQVPTVWAKGRWKVFLNSPEEVQRSIRYVEQNPTKEGKRRQHWSFVHPYE